VRDHDAAEEFLAWTPVSLAEMNASIRPREEFIIGDLMRVLQAA